MAMTGGMKAGLAALVVAAAAGGGWWFWQSHPHGGQDLGSTAEIGSEQAFAFMDCKPRMFDGSPAIAVSFTQPLDRKQDFGALLKATESAIPDPKAKNPSTPDAKPVEARWVLGDNPRVLYLPYVTPERQFHIAIDAGVAATNGAKLPVAQSCELASESMPTSFYFASKGIVLPAGQNGGLPVISVNVPEVDVQFLRVRPDALPRFLEQVGGRRENKQESESVDAGEDGEGGGYYGDYYDSSRKLKGTVGGYILDELRTMSDSIYIGRFTTDQRPNRRNVNFLPVEKIKELQEPGIYIAVMSQPGRFGWDYQVTHYYVTDIGLHLRRHLDQLDVFATSLKKGTALSGIELTLVDDAGKSLGQAKTDGDGHAVFSGRSERARVLLARRGDQEMSVLALRDPALDLSEFDAIGWPSRNNKLFVYAGRDLYRPGESFQASILARNADGQLPAKLTPLTLTLKKPDGSNVSNQLIQPRKEGSGYFQQTITLPPDAPTGTWMLQARVDPAAKLPDAQWPFKVEEFLPERMKLDLKAPDAVLSGDETGVPVQVSGMYLYGAPAAGNQLQASLYTERQTNPLAQKLPGFIFGDFADDKAKKYENLEAQSLDEQGKAEVTLAPELGERKSPMLIRGSFSLLESGGRPVVRSIERSWWPATKLVGIRPLFDRNVAPEGALAEFEVTRVDAAGRVQPAKELQVRLVYEERQWYWRYDDGRGWNSGFNVSEETADARSVALSGKDRIKIAVPVKYGRYRLEVTDPETSLTTRYAFYAGWGAQDADDAGNRPDRVQLKLQGAPFKPGQTAKLNIKPPHDGEALLTVEGDRVLYQKRLSVSASGTDVEIPIAADDPAWQRHDLYITVAAFRPGSQGDQVTPARALGLVYLPLDREQRKIKIALTAPPKTRPETELPVKVSAPALAGKPAIVTVSAVDVGILNITRYKTPDPVDFFFGKHRYDADILDLYGKLIEKMDGTAAKQRFGGDAGKRDTQSMPRKVLLVDLFSGPVTLDAKGEANIKLKLPDFNGTLRLMAVVSSADSYGSTQAETVVAAPLVAELNLPRFIAPGDTATIALDLTNLSGSTQTINVQVDASGPLKITGKPEPVTLADKKRQILKLQAQATDAYGLAPIKLTVSAGDLKLTREAALQVQPATPLTRSIVRQRLEPGATMKLDAAALDSYWPGSAAMSVTLSSSPPIDIRAQVQGLLTYPYGCLEQTTSSAYPLLYIDEAAADSFKLKGISREERAKRLDEGFARLSAMQQAKGGFGLWSASSPYEAWLSAYVTGFLQDARAAGFNVPEAMLKHSLDSLTEQFQRAPGYQLQPPKEVARDAKGRISDYRAVEALRQAHQRFAEAAFAGYVLAREQKAPLATLRTLFDQWRGNARSPLPLLQLGIALQLMGDEARAKVAIDEAMKKPYGLQLQTASDDGSGYYDYWNDWLGDYGSRVRDYALGYALMHRHKIAHERREGLLFDLAADFQRRSYYSTQERLALFLAVYSARGAADGKGWKAELDGQALSGKDSLQQPVTAERLKAGATLRNDGDAPLFVEAAAQGYPVKPPVPQADAITIERELFDTKGQSVSGKRDFATGDLLIVRLRVTAKQQMNDGLVVDRIPAGFEVENLTLSQGPQGGEFAVQGTNIAEANANPRIVHTEYRDDRFVAAAKLGREKLEVFYLVRAVTPGHYVVPAPYAEDMYRPELRGIGKAEADINVIDRR
ncbi:alpha-2-macroglobulin [Paucibacter sp. R3-3]|uniref:Alpha-2-macroglobulin n=2 Tax=Roseateles agri TaxID=3098619 RepID=A0ABU5DB39_9BURK|nr:alpha-2-macroglobulin [Paucibacter sp. R3-3]MDY0743443.1 alpha-2-macroglobulin [Paucibacter sp. R3-3]